MGKKELSDTPLTDAVLDHIRRMQDNMSYGDLLMIQHAERMERGRAVLLNLLTAIADGSPHTPAQYWSERARAAIAKATGASHE